MWTTILAEGTRATVKALPEMGLRGRRGEDCKFRYALRRYFTFRLIDDILKSALILYRVRVRVCMFILLQRIIFLLYELLRGLVIFNGDDLRGIVCLGN